MADVSPPEVSGSARPPTPAAAGPAATGAAPPVPTAQQSAERMQALLSRAVEDQLTEQRSFAAALAELRSQLTQLADELRSTAPIEGLERLSEGVASLSADLRGATEALGQRVEALSAEVRDPARQPDTAVPVRLASLASDLAAQGSAVDTVLDKVGGLPDALAALKEQVGGLDLAALRTDLAGLVESGDAALSLKLDAGHDALVGRHEELGGRLASLADTQASVSGKLDALADTQASVSGKLDALADTQASLARTLASIDGKLDAGLDLSGLLGSVAGVERSLVDELSRSEERLRGYVDDAVVTLAQTLLRRRGAPGQAAPARVQPHVPAPAPAGDSAPATPAEPVPSAAPPPARAVPDVPAPPVTAEPAPAAAPGPAPADDPAPGPAPADDPALRAAAEPAPAPAPGPAPAEEPAPVTALEDPPSRERDAAHEDEPPLRPWPHLGRTSRARAAGRPQAPEAPAGDGDAPASGWPPSETTGRDAGSEHPSAQGWPVTAGPDAAAAPESAPTHDGPGGQPRQTPEPPSWATERARSWAAQPQPLQEDPETTGDPGRRRPWWRPGT